MMKRRTLLATGAAALAAPHVTRSQAAQMLRFAPQIDVPLLDPVVTSAYISRNHGFVVVEESSVLSVPLWFLRRRPR